MHKLCMLNFIHVLMRTAPRHRGSRTVQYTHTHTRGPRSDQSHSCHLVVIYHNDIIWGAAGGPININNNKKNTTNASFSCSSSGTQVGEVGTSHGTGGTRPEWSHANTHIHEGIITTVHTLKHHWWVVFGIRLTVVTNHSMKNEHAYVDLSPQGEAFIHANCRNVSYQYWIK